jgi:trk system potassium uptake protein TrkH
VIANMEATTPSDFPSGPLVLSPRRREIDLRLVPKGFAALILFGAFLLLLPWSHQPGHAIHWIDALFLSTSAVCVTGLSTMNVAETFNGFGQAVLLGLMQAGGLGIFTGSILLVLASGNRLSLSDEQTIRATLGKLRQARPLDVFIYGCVFVVVLELAGTVALFALLSQAQPDTDSWQTLWEALFHSVSAFCNAGISIYPEGLARWRDRGGILAVISLLVILGGIGLMTLINQASLVEQFSWSFFHSAMARTAGFNVVDVDRMNPPTLLATMGLMFIGGAPGSMAGGIKTVTFVVLLMTALSALRRRDEVQFGDRRLARGASSIAW